MVDKFDNSLFEEKKYDENLFEDKKYGEEPVSKVEEPSKTEAFLRGAAQGVTFDFADELAGALGAAG